MPTRWIKDIPDGSDVFIDANIFIYAFGELSAECTDLLLRCSREEVFGVCLFETVNEATHRFMLAEAKFKGKISSENARELRGKLGIVMSLTKYWQNTIRVLDLNLLFVPLDAEMPHRAFVERRDAGLLTNDSMIVSSMRFLGVQNLASADRDFDRVAGITVFGPSDLPT